jgi:hypothetical protein
MMNKKHKSGKNGEFKCTTSGGIQRCVWMEAEEKAEHWLGERDLSWTPPIDKPEQPRIIIDPEFEDDEDDSGESPIMGAGQKFAQLRIEDFSPKMKAPRSKSKKGVRRGGGSASVSGGGGKG